MKGTTGPRPLQVLVVSYSRTGTCRRLAQALCAETGWPSGEILAKDAGRGMWRAVADLLLHRPAAPGYRGPPLADFRLVVLVAPVEGQQLAPTVQDFVAAYRGQLRNVALLSVRGRLSSYEAAEEITWHLGRAPVLSATVLARDVHSGAFAPRLRGIQDAIATLA